jgi:hypothetical protein
MARGFVMNSRGLNSKLSELFGNAEAFKAVKNCDREVKVMTNLIHSVGVEV